MAGSSAAWPAVAYEERTWEPAVDVRDSFSPHRVVSGPYRASVPPLISTAPLAVGTEALANASEATVDLIRLDAELSQRDPALGDLLLKAECAASSAIERVTASAEAIMLAGIDESLEPAARQIIAHVRADEVALGFSRALTEDAIVQVQRTLMATTRPDRRGRWRDQQVWIGGGSLGPQRASFVPPHQSRVPELMADLTAFMRRTDLPTLAQIAVAHAQYETIHPFLEVNGRTGRALMQAMLRRADILRTAVLPLSAGLLQDTAEYFDALTRYRAGQADAIVNLFATAAHTAVATSRILMDDLDAVRGSWDRRATARQGSAARRLLQLLVGQPVINSRQAVAYLGVTAPNALLAIDRLVDDGILTQIGSGRRNRTWAARDVLQALDALAERTRRHR